VFFFFFFFKRGGWERESRGKETWRYNIQTEAFIFRHVTWGFYFYFFIFFGEYICVRLGFLSLKTFQELAYKYDIFLILFCDSIRCHFNKKREYAGHD
jgi:hypothetical protein